MLPGKGERKLFKLLMACQSAAWGAVCILKTLEMTTSARSSSRVVVCGGAGGGGSIHPQLKILIAWREPLS